jgi:NADH-ubiquinone oxidoreductase chain 6
MHNFLLDVLAFAALFSGILVITSKNPVISVLFLISVFLNVAGYLVLLGVAYLGLTYLIVYVGAIAILFLFVIMMLNLRLVELIETGEEYTKNLPLGLIVGFLFIFEFFSIIPLGTININNLFLDKFINLSNYLNSKLMDVDLSHHYTVTSNSVHQGFNDLGIDLNLTSFLQIQSIGQGLYLQNTL